MRATITRYLEALKNRRSSDEGFSLIELIVVVVILGILVAIAIPVFGTLQANARQNSLNSVAANAATQVAAGFANNTPVAAPALATSFPGATFTVTGTSVDAFCVTASPDGATSPFAGALASRSGTATGCTGTVTP